MTGPYKFGTRRVINIAVGAWLGMSGCEMHAEKK